MTTTIATQTGSGGKPGEVCALKDIASHLRFWPAAVLILALDLWSKSWVFGSLGPNETWRAIPHIIDFHRSLNDGAVFGSLTGMTTLFAIASVFAFGFVLMLFAGSSTKQKCLHIALGLILAGAMGNLFDRAFAKADVIHFTGGSKVIGVVLGDADDNLVEVGNWPNGEMSVYYALANIESINRQGVVRDFIRFVPRFPSWFPVLSGKDVWPWVFNVADSALVCGVGLLLINFWIDRKRLRGSTADSAQEEPA